MSNKYKKALSHMIVWSKVILPEPMYDLTVASYYITSQIFINDAIFGFLCRFLTIRIFPVLRASRHTVKPA